MIVDDHPVTSHGLRNVFAKDNSLVVVGEAGETKEAVKVVERCKPDVIVLDISLGRGDGVSLIATLSKASPHSKVVTLCVFTKPKLKSDTLEDSKE